MNSWRELVTHPQVHQIIELALKEDIGPGDVTTAACVPAAHRSTGQFFARQQLVVAGVELLEAIYTKLGGVERLEILVESGQVAENGQPIARVIGPTRTLLTAERVCLNFLQRLSGIATYARKLVEAVEGTGCIVLDTRKTMPGMRLLEKMATATGGMKNHRMGLYDAVLIKNNHIAAVGDLREAIRRARAAGLPVEIEVRTREELSVALEEGVQRVLIDNVTPEEARDLVKLVHGRAEVEISGGITLENIRSYAASGAQYISCGAVTHSAPAANLNFRLQAEP